MMKNDASLNTSRRKYMFYGASSGAVLALLLIYRMNDGIESVDHDALFSVAGLILVAMEVTGLVILAAIGAQLGRYCWKSIQEELDQNDGTTEP